MDHAIGGLHVRHLDHGVFDRHEGARLRQSDVEQTERDERVARSPHPLAKGEDALVRAERGGLLTADVLQDSQRLERRCEVGVLRPESART